LSCEKEFHPRALRELDVTVSRHPATIVLPVKGGPVHNSFDSLGLIASNSLSTGRLKHPAI